MIVTKCQLVFKLDVDLSHQSCFMLIKSYSFSVSNKTEKVARKRLSLDVDCDSSVGINELLWEPARFHSGSSQSTGQGNTSRTAASKN